MICQLLRDCNKLTSLNQEYAESYIYSSNTGFELLMLQNNAIAARF